MADRKLTDLPEPAFRLTWKGERAAYYVSKPGIDSTDCYTAEQMRAYALASPPVAVQEERDAWQPIETAPKDGKEFLAIWGRQGNLMQVVRWNMVHKFYQAKGEPIIGFSSNATAWQPLPPPPAAMKGDQP